MLVDDYFREPVGSCGAERIIGDTGALQKLSRVLAHLLQLEQSRYERSQIGVLRTAVAAARIADTGRVTPLFSTIDDAESLRRISAVAETLSKAEAARPDGSKSTTA